jgi:hypothetical protein
MYDNVGFREKRQYFCTKLAKIAENNDYNIDPSWASCGAAWMDITLHSLFDEWRMAILRLNPHPLHLLSGPFVSLQ